MDSVGLLQLVLFVQGKCCLPSPASKRSKQLEEEDQLYSKASDIDAKKALVKAGEGEKNPTCIVLTQAFRPTMSASSCFRWCLQRKVASDASLSQVRLSLVRRKRCHNSVTVQVKQTKRHLKHFSNQSKSQIWESRSMRAFSCNPERIPAYISPSTLALCRCVQQQVHL